MKHLGNYFTSNGITLRYQEQHYCDFRIQTTVLDGATIVGERVGNGSQRCQGAERRTHGSAPYAVHADGAFVWAVR
jgi:hypothetical protein